MTARQPLDVRVRAATHIAEPTLRDKTFYPPLAVLLSSLALGGAERIVLDWAHRNCRRYRIAVAVLHSQETEWPLPPGIGLHRLRRSALAEDIEDFTRTIAAEWRDAGAGAPPILCHLVRQPHREAVVRGGGIPVPVIHNDRNGWLEPAAALGDCGQVVAVSAAAASQLKADGYGGECTVIRHLPGRSATSSAIRSRLARRYQLRPTAKWLMMVGGIKPQKNYPAALRILAELRRHDDYQLVVFGGIASAAGRQCWEDMVRVVADHKLFDHVRFAGFEPNAGRYLGAFDALINTSHWEGLSIATLEALAAGRPAICSKVGGQGEVWAPGLTLMASECAPVLWAKNIARAIEQRPEPPRWTGFPAHRLWTLAHLVGRKPFSQPKRIAFLTANLNAGGAQRSLVNLVKRLHPQLQLEVLVTGHSSTGYFVGLLRQSGVPVHVTEDSRDCFDHAETIAFHLATQGTATLCIWNLDPKIKLLLAKMLPAAVRLIDVSPGGYAFDEMAETADFQRAIGFSELDYYTRLNQLVVKFNAVLPPHIATPVRVIPNGVPISPAPAQGRRQSKRVVVSGRIAPSKYLLEIANAMPIVWRRHPDAELHVIGHAEPRHQQYLDELLAVTRHEIDERVHFQGHDGDVPSKLARYDLAVVMGHHQGCPNSILEAMAAGLPVVANDSGGTREIVRDNENGVLLPTLSSEAIADAIVALLDNPRRRESLGRQARAWVEQNFSMGTMERRYCELLKD